MDETFKEEAKKEHEALRLTGMFYEFYSELTGDWEEDKEEWYKIYEKLRK